MQSLSTISTSSQPKITTVYHNGLAVGWRDASYGCLKCNYSDSDQVSRQDSDQAPKSGVLDSHTVVWLSSSAAQHLPLVCCQHNAEPRCLCNLHHISSGPLGISDLGIQQVLLCQQVGNVSSAVVQAACSFCWWYPAMLNLECCN